MGVRHSILVVGAGFGGLAVAGRLARLGHHVTIVEQQSSWPANKLGVTLGENALAVLKRWGSIGALLEVSRPIHRVDLCDKNGRSLSSLQFPRKQGELPMAVAIRRDDLHRVLRPDAAECELLFATTVRRAEVAAAKARVTLSNGAEREVDAMIVADGARAPTAELCGLGRPSKRTGVSCWVFTVEGDTRLEAPMELLSDGARVGLVPLPNGAIYGYASLRTELETSTLPAASFAEFGEPARSLLDRIDKPQHLAIAHAVAPRWTRGPITLLGDAAHLAPPDLGQGVAMALEDAEVLAGFVAGAERIGLALERYETRRRPITTRMVRLSTAAHELLHTRGKNLNLLRDASLRWIFNGAITGRVVQQTLRLVSHAGSALS